MMTPVETPMLWATTSAGIDGQPAELARAPRRGSDDPPSRDLGPPPRQGQEVRGAGSSAAHDYLNGDGKPDLAVLVGCQPLGGSRSFKSRSAWADRSVWLCALTVGPADMKRVYRR